MSSPQTGAVVDAPPLAPSPLNLVRSSRNPRDAAGVRWQAGITYRPRLNVAATTFGLCGGATTDLSTVPTNPAVVTWMPIVVEVSYQCSSFGFDATDWEGDVRALLDAATPKALERELWSGTTTRAEGFDNLWLADSHAVDVTPGGSPVSVKRGYEVLEEALGDSGVGARGMIHARRGAIPNFTGVRIEGNLLVTMNDTIVVPGSGYTGEGPSNAAPASGTTWMYATGITDVRIDDQVIVVPNRDTGERFQVDRDTNTITIRAERLAMVSWDGQQHFAVHVTYEA